jgi:sugar phosphate isomerase/epimerase
MSKKKIVFQGEPGANSHLAISQAYPDAEAMPCATFEDAFTALSAGDADLGMIPIENSVAGRVADIHHLMPNSKLHIIAEHFMPVQHQLLGIKGAKLEDIKALAAEFNAFGEAFKAEGIRFGLHNHGIEFGTVGDKGEFAFDVFALETKPDLVCLELDVFWAVNAGQDPVKLLQKYPNRFVALHVKDLRKGATTGTGTGSAPATDNVPVGTGQMDWPAIIRAAQADGVRFYFIEDETPTPLECIPATLSYLRGLKL